MSKDLPKIVFMGTPEFAVASLAALVENGFPVVGVVTAPDKPAGRGMKISQSAVKTYALQHGLKILQPEKLRSIVFLDELRELEADLQVVVAFRMLPEVVWNMPPMGTINVHASLLPQYRGAAPINWVLINGERETGITTFKLQQEIDTGNILMQEKTPIDPNETAGELHNRLKTLGARVLMDTIRGLVAGTIKEIPQPPVVNPQREEAEIFHDFENFDLNFQILLKTAPKIHTDTCRIDWTQPTFKIFNLIRGLSPYPGAFSLIDGKMIKIFRCQRELAPHHLNPGTWQTDGKSILKCATSDGFILAKEIQLEGKRRMEVDEFLRGYRFTAKS